MQSVDWVLLIWAPWVNADQLPFEHVRFHWCVTVYVPMVGEGHATEELRGSDDGPVQVGYVHEPIWR